MSDGTRHTLISIAITALKAVADMTPTPSRQHDMWMLAINRVRQTEADVKADEEIAAMKERRQ